MKRYLKPLFFTRRFYSALAAIIGIFIIGYNSLVIFWLAKIILGIFSILLIIDYAVLFFSKSAITASRIAPERMSNGDDNRIGITVVNNYRFRTWIKIIDEVPEQFQLRDFLLHVQLDPQSQEDLSYSLRPLERGEYQFYDLNVFVSTPLKLVIRRFRFQQHEKIKVYPSYLQLKKYDIVAHSNNLSEAGNRKIRKIGRSVEFEQIREYVNGDDIRTINWKATAREGGKLMVNSYTDERSQQIYCIIDKGRVMKMPFNDLTLLDYAINSSLILSRVALLKQDRVGLVTFASNIDHVLPASRREGQMNQVLEALYRQRTDFGETDFEKLYALVTTRITQRSCIVLFTNFESLTGLQRQLPYIRAIAARHLLLVVFFENTALRSLTSSPADDIETLYIRTIAEKFIHEKHQMVKELQQHGIFTILTAPQDLTVNTVNKYLELKARQAI